MWSCNVGAPLVGGVSFSDAFIKVGPHGTDGHINPNSTDSFSLFKAWRSSKARIRAYTVLEPSLDLLELYDNGQCRNGLRGKLINDAVQCFKKYEEHLGKVCFFQLFYHVKSKI